MQWPTLPMTGRSGPRLFIMLALSVTLVAAGAWQVRGTLAARAPIPRIDLVGPAEVRLGEPIFITLRAHHVADVAGYEGLLQFDPAKARFRGVTHESNDVRKLGRDVQPLGPVERDDGVSFGAYSCPVALCTDAIGRQRKPKGAQGVVDLAQFSLTPEVSGPLTIALTDVVMVDALGNSITISVRRGELTVQVTEGQGG